jgi:hypothetical protein
MVAVLLEVVAARVTTVAGTLFVVTVPDPPVWLG